MHVVLTRSCDEYRSRRLGQIVAKAGQTDFEELLRNYTDLFMQTLRRKANPQKHANVLFHILGYFKKKRMKQINRKSSSVLKITGTVIYR